MEPVQHNHQLIRGALAASIIISALFALEYRVFLGRALHVGIDEFGMAGKEDNYKNFYTHPPAFKDADVLITLRTANRRLAYLILWGGLERNVYKLLDGFFFDHAILFTCELEYAQTYHTFYVNRVKKNNDVELMALTVSTNPRTNLTNYCNFHIMIEIMFQHQYYHKFNKFYERDNNNTIPEYKIVGYKLKEIDSRNMTMYAVYEDKKYNVDYKIFNFVDPNEPPVPTAEELALLNAPAPSKSTLRLFVEFLINALVITTIVCLTVIVFAVLLSLYQFNRHMNS